MTYPQSYPQVPYIPPQPPSGRPKSAGLAIASLVLGIVGVVLSFMPIINNFSAAGGVVGFVLGMVGLWRSRVVMAAIGTFLSGVAVILTIVAQQQFVDELDKIGDDSDDAVPANSLSTDTETAPGTSAEPVGYTPTAADWELEVVVTEQQCFGSAGCNVTMHVELTYLAAEFPDAGDTYQLVYDVAGTEDALRGSMEITGDQHTMQDHFVQTTSANAALTAKIVSFERIG